jgi:hypothetical protein
MRTKDIIGFQFGRSDAIRTVASSSSAFWTGIVLVLLTAFARNYDQTYIAEKWLLWFLGPLIFSTVSGTWLFTIAYATLARNTMADIAGNKPRPSPAWRGFMGAFWMTAPIAWIYAIPVERFFDSLDAAKANLTLLSVVSLWRVLLMARVLQVVCVVPFVRALLWVLLPALVEVVLVVFFGGAFSKALLASMGGMRNSPEEDLLVQALGTAMTISFWGVPVVAAILGLWCCRHTAQAWPATQPSPMPFRPLLVAAAFWVAITIPAQMELRRNHIVEQFCRAGDMRAAIEFMNRHRREDFAPARPLPPKLYERTAFTEVPQFVAALRAGDAPWIQQRGTEAATIFVRHLAWPYRMDTPLENIKPGAFLNGLQRWRPPAADIAAMLTNLSSLDLGRAWLASQPQFLTDLAAATHSVPDLMDRKSPDEKNRAGWRAIAVELNRLGYTNVASIAVPAPVQ